ncbi:hypothetical protein B0H17DRAFT_1129232 [Mycena rosella]|uniref:Uncharacterized protein n=1 Tax=Mycena rosella TaxID=1033263 RepID=A0AAD7DUG4_MYCRO|nr:hypothetical protein B0H17DRAFT_1129232 [Mycena rosella]
MPTSACARRPDRARVVTENAAEPLTSTRPRTRTAPGHLVLVPVPPTPVGAAVRRIMPLYPLEVHAVPTANAVTLHDTLSAAHYVPRTIIYQTTARPVSSAILYETPPLAPSNIIYSTSGTSMLPVLRSPRSPRPARRQKIIYHARSAVPTFAPHPDLAHNTFTRAQAEAQQCANQQYYLAQHRPNALAQLLGRAQEETRNTASPAPDAHSPIRLILFLLTLIRRHHFTRQPSMSASRCLGRRADVLRLPGRVHDTEERARRG